MLKICSLDVLCATLKLEAQQMNFILLKNGSDL